MKEHVDEILGILESEYRIHRELTETAREMNTALKAKDVARVKSLSASYDEHTYQIEELEEKRLEVCDRLAGALHLKGRHYNLTAITKALSEDLRPPLAGIREKLKGAMSELSRLNVSNQILLQDSLESVARAMSMMVQGDNKYAGYKQGGRRDDDASARRMINRTA